MSEKVAALARGSGQALRGTIIKLRTVTFRENRNVLK